MAPVLIIGLIVLMMGGLLAWLRRGWVVVTVEGRSMAPTLVPGDRVLVRRIPPARIQVGQVVVVEKPVDGGWRTPPLAHSAAPATDRSWIVKRAVAGPGDPVPTDVMPATFAGDVATSRSGVAGSDGDIARVPLGQFMLLGDNRDGSLDSRSFGFVPGSRILGPVHRRMGPA
ncbi:signal peptidase I [Micromonospora palomenae]|uniref:signal peptidase I n=1 Tax=Micromonospora palomenae TaxID=1461247 RepID=UPI003F8B7DCF